MQRAFTGRGQEARRRRPAWPNWSAKSASRRMEIDFLKRALQHVEEQRLLRALSNGAPSTNRSKKK